MRSDSRERRPSPSRGRTSIPAVCWRRYSRLLASLILHANNDNVSLRYGQATTLMKFNWPLMPGCLKIVGIRRGGIPMSELADQNIERLSHLFASGSMKHAREIARLLSEEIGEPSGARPEPGLISRLLGAAPLGKPQA